MSFEFGDHLICGFLIYGFIFVGLVIRLIYVMIILAAKVSNPISEIK